MTAGTTSYRPGDLIVAYVPFVQEAGGKPRPAVVISTEKYNRATSHLVVLPVTTRVPAWKSEALKLSRGDLPLLNESKVVLESIGTIPDSHVKHVVGKIDPAQLDRALNHVRSILAEPRK